MIITLIIHILIIVYILFKAFCISKKAKSFNNSTNILLFQDSVNLTAMPFYINMGRIQLFTFFINFFFLNLIVLSELIPNNTAFCMSSLSFENKKETTNVWTLFEATNEIISIYEITKKNYPYIYYLNNKNISIENYLKVFQGFSKNIDEILKKQNIIFNEMDIVLNKNLYYLVDFKNITLLINEENINISYLISNAYKKILFSYNESIFSKHYDDNLFSLLFNKKTDNVGEINKIIRDFIGDHQLYNLNIKINKLFNINKEIQQITLKNYHILNEIYIEAGGNDTISFNNKISFLTNVTKKGIIEKKKNINELCNYSPLSCRSIFLCEMNTKYIQEKINHFHEDNLILKNKGFLNISKKINK